VKKYDQNQKQKRTQMSLHQHTENKITIKSTTNHLKITPQKFKQLYNKYKTTIGKNLADPKNKSPKKQSKT
jgi:hypothetical protein